MALHTLASVFRQGPASCCDAKVAARLTWYKAAMLCESERRNVTKTTKPRRVTHGKILGFSVMLALCVLEKFILHCDTRFALCWPICKLFGCV